MAWRFAQLAVGGTRHRRGQSHTDRPSADRRRRGDGAARLADGGCATEVSDSILVKANKRIKPTFRKAALCLSGVYALLLLIYAPTMLTQVGGGENPYMDDVSEAQVTLNLWGTFHHSGYPLWTISGNVFVSALRAIGLAPEVAPTLHSTFWHLIALGVGFALLLHLTDDLIVATACTFLLGLPRTLWFHAVVPEVYSLSLVFQLGLIAIAVWRGIPIYRRLMLLALIGGLGVAHHRLIALLAPALLYAVLPEAWQAFREAPRRALLTALAALATGAAGFLPYVYLPLRAQAGAIWVYNDPSTWSGFWHEFTGAEAAFLFTLPNDLTGILENVGRTLGILWLELSPVLLIPCAIALIALPLIERRLGVVLWLAFGAHMLWLALLHRVVMPEAVAMPMSALLIVALGVAWSSLQVGLRYSVGLQFAALSALILISLSSNFVSALTSDPIGIQAIAAAKRVPRQAATPILMLPWGPRHAAVAFSVYVTGENADLRLVKHTADLAALSREGALYTLRDTFYRFPLTWWREQLGAAHLSAPALDVVQIRTVPQRADEALEIAEGVGLVSAALCRAAEGYRLDIEWAALRKPERDLSVFVHLLSAESDVPLAQADSSAPVYGWYPTTLWQAGELVRDQYLVPQAQGGKRLAFGLYWQPESGRFETFKAREFALSEVESCDSGE
ncbi:MAG: hypothetical protein CUN49_01750 [Candidatus Thermofonsia Clade 1 bacterium]|uniref:DUF2723 domain-containing protein n=1 Tax=Candidatus Thermofonsia Clade 1 bacterium TaxID=2364210 RepID=A0A2M8PHY9_9CHLR|nr:MAG: hypothetical protein CUN49_01750 [Candidatus Thermofonsia Clade 1 bacterium]